jgi:hypothetical protein
MTIKPSSRAYSLALAVNVEHNKDIHHQVTCRELGELLWTPALYANCAAYEAYISTNFRSLKVGVGKHA